MKVHDKHNFIIHNEQIILINLHQKSHTNTKMLRFKKSTQFIFSGNYILGQFLQIRTISLTNFKIRLYTIDMIRQLHSRPILKRHYYLFKF
jgi:hypothetical protein